MFRLTRRKGQYGVPDGSKASPGNELGVFESLNDHYSKADLDAYFNSIYPYAHRF